MRVLVAICVIGMAVASGSLAANAKGMDKGTALTQCRAETPVKGAANKSAAVRACVERKMKGE